MKGSVFHVISLISAEISEAPRGASLAQWQSQDAKNHQKLKERPACSWKWHVLSRQQQAKSCKTCTQLPRQSINACRLTGQQVHSGVSTSHRWLGIRRTQVQHLQPLKSRGTRQSYANKHKIGKTNRNIQTLAVYKNLKDLE